MAELPKGFTTGLFYPNIPAPEEEAPEYDDTYKIPDNTPRAGYVPFQGQQPLGDNNPKGTIPGMPVAGP